MQQVYNLFGEAMSISAWLDWPVRMLRVTLLSEEGKKILGVWRWRPSYCSTVMEGFIVGAALVSCTMSRLKQDKTDNVNLKWDSSIICNRWCKIHHQKVLDVKHISRATAAPTDAVNTVHSELNWRNWTLQSKLNFTVETDWTSSRALQ